MSGMYTSGLIGLTEENVGIDRRFYTNRTDTNPTLAVSYNNGRVDVYLNGVKLVGNHAGNSNHDYTMDNVTGTGTTITLATGVALVATDVLELVGYVSNSSNTVQTYNFNVTTNTTAFTASHTASSLVNVYLNGVLLDSSDYTLNGSDTVTLGSNAVNGDVVAIQVIGALDYSNFVPESGGTFSGDVAVNGDLTVDTNTLKVNSTTNRVGVGRNDPQTTLDVAHSGSSNSGAVRIGDPSTISNNTSIYMRTTGDAVIGTGGGNIAFDTNIGSAERLRIHHSTGNVEVKTGNLVIGTAGQGITFQDTSSANDSATSSEAYTLKGYETGSWTPSISGTGDFSSTAFEKYIKVGGLCTVFFYATFANSGRPTSGPIIIPLPLPMDTATFGTNGEFSGTGNVMFKHLDIAGTLPETAGLVPYVFNQNLYFYWSRLDNNWQALNWSDVNNDAKMYASVTYPCL